MWIAVIGALVVTTVMLLVYQNARSEKSAPTDPATPAGLVLASEGEGTALAAVGRTHGLTQACTAWLVAPGTVDVASTDDPAYAVTAGRCVGIDDSNTVLSARQLSGASVDFSAFAALTKAAAPTLQSAAITAIEWASMRFTDLALLRLDRSYADLSAAGVRPIPAADVGEAAEVLVAGVPVAGIPADERFVRVAKCRLGDTVAVLEGPWLFSDAHATDCGGIRTGSAGSPALDPAGEAVGMIVSTTIGRVERSADCPVDSPCAVTDTKVDPRANTSYVVPVAGLAECFPGGHFRRTGDCPFENPATVVAATPARRSAQPGGQIRVQLSSTSKTKLPADALPRKVARKVGALPATDCHATAGWSKAVAPADWRLTVTMPAASNWVLACVGRPGQPTPVIMSSDNTAPDASPLELITEAVRGGVSVGLAKLPDDVALVWWTSGPAGTDCAAAEGFTKYRGQAALIPADDLPAVVCLVAQDAAGNRSPPVTRDVE